MRHGKYPFVIGFLFAPVALYVVFVIAPYAQAFQLSMTNWRGLSAPQCVGFDNYRRLLDDAAFWKAVQHHGVLLLALPLITIAIALFFAFLLNVGGEQRGRATPRGLGVEVLPGGVLLPAGAGPGHRRGDLPAGVPARTSPA